MSLDDYKLSCELHGHSLDVRAVTEGQIGTIISGSRDKTAKIWQNEGNAYVEALTLANHKNFISSVCTLEQGQLICTGSNDSTICVYTAGNTVPLAVLKGHTSTVCSLSAGLEPNTLISGSWDKTARIWTIAGFGPSASHALVGHEAAVWAVTTLSKRGQFVTGSADKTICFWNQNGERLKILKGHTDCVRGLIGLADGGLISCGNDAIIKYWSEDGECIKEFYGHSNYIYTIALNHGIVNAGDAGGLNDSVYFVTGGEDSTIRLWNSKGTEELGKPIVLPAQSVWSVACLSNGDIVTGTSDGVVRVFTKDANRFASQPIQQAFTVAVQTRLNESKAELGGMKVNDLPGPESLLTDGTSDGQTKIVRHANGKILCYQWTNNEWLCLGDVTGASGGTQEKSGKVLYEGKEYDYVFSVDVSDNGVPLKLPYNCSEEPWLVAQKFIHTHELPQAYLEQVANFIIKNSSDKAPTSQRTTTGYEDPFTGGGRYIPGSTSANNAGSGSGNFGSGDVEMVDPFTGSSSYRTAQASAVGGGGGGGGVGVGSGHQKMKYFPHSTYVSFSTCDPQKVLVKIKELNSKLTDDTLKVSESSLENVIKFASTQPTAYTPDNIDNLKPLLKWPKDILFPVLDIARLAVRNQTVCKELLSPDFINILLDNMSHGPANQLMSIRCVSNMMSHELGRHLVQQHLLEIIDRVSNIHTGSGNLQIAIASLYLNITITQIQQTADQEICRLITETLLDFLHWSIDLEAIFRSYQALGNLTCTPHGLITSAQIVSVDKVSNGIRENMNRSMPTGFVKLNDVAKDLISAL